MLTPKELAEAIKLGSLIVKPKSLQYLKEGEGCAIGMAMAALNRTSQPMMASILDITAFERELPNVKISASPCGHEFTWDHYVNKDMTGGQRWLGALITHIFDRHILPNPFVDYGVKADWTLDRLCEFIAGLEMVEEKTNVQVPETVCNADRVGDLPGSNGDVVVAGLVSSK